MILWNNIGNKSGDSAWQWRPRRERAPVVPHSGCQSHQTAQEVMPGSMMGHQRQSECVVIVLNVVFSRTSVFKQLQEAKKARSSSEAVERLARMPVGKSGFWVVEA